MSEEEKKAIEYLKENSIPILRYDNYGNILNPLYFGTEEKQTIINLIEKQQKEIEELKQENDEIDFMTIHINGFYDGEKKWKDKIREKIKKAKEIKWHTPKLVIEYFEELLEEN